MKGMARMLRKFWLAAWFAALCAAAGPALAESTLAVDTDAVPMAGSAGSLPVDTEPPLPEPMASLPPETIGEAGVPVSLAADQLDYDGTSGVFHARGAVSLEQGELRLTADQLFWQDTTRDAVADGQVQLVEPGGELHGSSLQANFTTGLGRLENGQVFLKERNFHLAGDEIERLGAASYRVSGGRFTTCDGDRPAWQFSAAQVDVSLGSYAVAREVWFEVGSQPLLYLPYLVFPVKQERESGFLLPRVGYSSRKGALLSLAWYEVIDRHLDATVYLDYLSRLGLGKGLEYRYALGADNLGEARYYHVSGFDETPDSYAIAWRHGGFLPGSIRLSADVEYVNRLEFFEDFGEAPEEYNQDHTVSTVMLQRNWDKLNLTGYARYIKDLENDNATTLQVLPEFGLTVPQYRLDSGPLYTRTELLATNFSRDEGDEGQRLYLRQGVGMVLKPGSWLEFNPEVALYGRYYHADEGEEDDLVPEYAATLSTRLVRVFPFEHWGIERLQHSIEPQVSYSYIPNHDQDDLPEFGRRDRIGPRNQVEYALVNRLTARATGADGVPVYREVLNLRLSQAYDVRTARDDDQDDPAPFSDLRAELMLRPTPRSLVELDALTRVHGDLQFSRFNAGAGYNDGRGNLARIDYRYRSADLNASRFDDQGSSGDLQVSALDYLEARLATAWLAPVHLGVAERYDFRDGRSLETVLEFEYRSQCWSLFVTFRDRPESEEVLVGFALSGLGRIGGFGSTLRPSEE
jgi:LPS-assembly protein